MDTSRPAQVCRCTVAFIDDDLSMRDAVRGLLRSNRVPVEVFGSAEDFLECSTLDGVGCVIADIRMPGGMSGFDLQRVLARQGRALPMVFVSSQGHTSWMARANALGATFLTKPFSEQALLDALDRACGIRT